MAFIGRLVQCTLGTIAAAGFLLAQADSRLAQIAEQQDQKATRLTPEQPNRLERVLTIGSESRWFGVLTNGVEGFRPSFRSISRPVATWWSVSSGISPP